MSRDLVYYMGIDPGVKGAMAFVGIDSEGGLQQLIIEDFPLVSVGSKSNQYHKAKDRKTICSSTTADILSGFGDMWGPIMLVMLETPHSLPNDGHVGAFNFGKALGHIEGILGALKFQVIGTVPSVWKSSLALSSVKQASIDLAKEKFKHIDGALDYFEKKKHHDRAEAALLAWLCAYRFGGMKVTK